MLVHVQSRHKPKKRKSGGKAAADPAPSPEQQAAALEDLALRAVRPTDAAGLWMTVLQAFAATNWPCQRLLDHLVATLWSRAKGPVEVRQLLPACALNAPSEPLECTISACGWQRAYVSQSEMSNKGIWVCLTQ